MNRFIEYTGFCHEFGHGLEQARSGAEFVIIRPDPERGNATPECCKIERLRDGVDPHYRPQETIAGPAFTMVFSTYFQPMDPVFVVENAPKLLPVTVERGEATQHDLDRIANADLWRDEVAMHLRSSVLMAMYLRRHNMLRALWSVCQNDIPITFDGRVVAKATAPASRVCNAAAHLIRTDPKGANIEALIARVVGLPAPIIGFWLQDHRKFQGWLSPPIAKAV